MANVLQPGTGPINGDAYLPSTPDTVSWGLLPTAADRPVLTVDSGSTVCFDTVSHEGLLADQGGDPAAFFGAAGIAPGLLLADARDIGAALTHRPDRTGPHIVTGPVAVRGARPGDVLEVQVLGLLRRAPYGVISNRHGRGALAGEFPIPPHGWPDGQPAPTVSLVARVDDEGRGLLPTGDGRAVRFPLAPFLGIMGVATAGDRPHDSVPPGPHGGNLDIRMLTEGARLYLPVQADGALFYTGDPHFAQGDGEVSLTAFEAPLRATLRLTLHRDPAVRRLAAELALPYAETADAHLLLGLDPDLDTAVRQATRNAVTFLRARHGLPPAVALAYLSAACDVRISQVVDRVKGAHFVLPKADLADLGPGPAADGEAS
ncbi:acetamidase/formamidase family protein [Kitasatospora indigofera]|uniref:acetamidase/formamidase family protein n=1 Tax=Kitasatospora indigofera TaxID=67307 RepID=UPI0036877A0A